MVDVHSVFGVVAGVVALLGFVPYALSVVRGTTQPSIASWLIWTLLGAVISASYFAAGSVSSWWLTASFAVGPFVILFLSLRVGKFSWDRLDSLYVVSALVGLAWWWLSGVAATAQTISVVVDLLGAVPTLKKCWLRPDSEDPIAWRVFFLASTLNLVAVERWSFESGLYPVYSSAIAGAMVLCVSRRSPSLKLAD